MSSLIDSRSPVKSPLIAPKAETIAIETTAVSGPVPTTRLVAIRPDLDPDGHDLAEMRASRASSVPIKGGTSTRPAPPALSLSPATRPDLVLEGPDAPLTLESLSNRLTPPHGVLVAPEPPNVGTEPPDFGAYLDYHAGYFARQETDAGRFVASLLRLTAEDVRSVSTPDIPIPCSTFTDRWDVWTAPR